MSVGAQRDVLGARVEVVVEELLDLALLLAGRGLVDRELDPPVPVLHDLAHQGAVLGVDHLVVVVDELAEAQHVAVEVHEPIHVAQLHVADAVVDLEQASARWPRRRLRDPVVAGRVRAGVVAPVDEGVDHLAVGVDGASVRRTPFSPGSSVGSCADRAPRAVVSRQADSTSSTANAMSWTPSPCRATCSASLAVRRDGRGEDEADVVLDHHVAGPVADPGLEAGIGDRREPPQGPEVVRRLLGVAHPELDVVDALERQEVGRLGGWRGLGGRHRRHGTPAGRARTGHGILRAMIILVFIIIGLVAGWVANRVVGARRGFTPLELFIVGLAGSVVGGTLFSLLLGEGFDLRPGGFIGAAVGAILILAVYGPIRDRMRAS